MQPATGLAFGNAVGATRLASAGLAETPVGAKASGIQSFTTHFPASDLVDLHHRIAATSWPERETVVDDSQGVQIATAAPKSAPRFGRYPARREEGARQLWEPGSPSQLSALGKSASCAGVICRRGDSASEYASRPESETKNIDAHHVRRGRDPRPMIFLRYWTRQILVSFRRHPRIPEDLAGEAYEVLSARGGISNGV